ncbi:MAG: NAD(P)(+) transhydrogenase (Re/Si-specific) subunit beta [Saprospiraceae bacterium]|nr:NAD(P)(+) transhydrogenase (Re/Si-specific) subunit beta [Saprospiraceae bacterium]
MAEFAYLIAVMAFVFGMRWLRHPDTAKKGNVLSALGMVIAVLTAIFQPLEGNQGNITWILVGLGLGTLIGLPLAKRVQMTSMPQLVAIFNGLGGASAMVLGFIEFQALLENGIQAPGRAGIILAALIIGAVSFSGSIIAFAKLEGLLKKDIAFPGYNIFNFGLLAAIVGLSIYSAAFGGGSTSYLVIITLLSLIYGISFVGPIGGADMPVVIALLNSLTGISAATSGLVYNNKAMLIGGVLVGASGAILTVLMCQAMNRSLWNVFFGKFVGTGGGEAVDGIMKEAGLSDVAIQLQYADSVMFVPGYGMAVAQAQKICKDVDDALTKNGVEVKYGIHPVAGRMPGHMNVLLAEADVPYDKLLDLDAANDFLKGSNVTVIIGANDVVNPAALTDKASPLFGMPILDVLQSDSVIVMKRGRGTGYSGVQNGLFFHDKTKLLFGDAKDSLKKLLDELGNS